MTQAVNTKVKKQLAEHLGLEPEDIKDEDTLINDLHMSASDLADFTEKLKKENIDVSKLDFSEIDTVTELEEVLGLDE